MPGDRRRVYSELDHLLDLIDNLDVVRVLIDLKSAYATAIANSIGRGEDDEIGQAFFAPAAVGEQGLSTINTFPAGQQVGVNVGGANSGLNVPKLRTAKRLLMASGLDPRASRLTSRSRPPSTTTCSASFRSRTWTTMTSQPSGRPCHHVQGLQSRACRVAGHGDGRCHADLPAVAAIHRAGRSRLDDPLPAGVGPERHALRPLGGLENRVDQRPDKNYNWQIWSEENAGATRTQEKKIVQIAVNSAWMAGFGPPPSLKQVLQVP